MKITMEHGSGGRATGELIDEVFAKTFANPTLSQMEDSAVVAGSKKLALTTDSFVVTPVEFPGGDIGRLCICGTVNDLLMRGAVPKYITCGFILQEGTDVAVLKRAVKSMADTAVEAGVCIVAGDTKVVENSSPNGGIIINTAGVGFIEHNGDIHASASADGDVVIVSGNLGDHHATILGQRLEITNTITSDNAPLTQMVANLLAADIKVHVLRDVTRGGLGTVLKELAQAGECQIEINETDIPVNLQVRDFCGLLGLDPVYMGNEGKLVAIVAKNDAQTALEIIKQSKYGADAAMIGSVQKSGQNQQEFQPGKVVLTTRLGGKRNLEVLQGEGLPRIC